MDNQHGLLKEGEEIKEWFGADLISLGLSIKQHCVGVVGT